MHNKYDLEELKQNALKNKLGAFQDLLTSFKELYRDHEDEHEIVGSFLLEHIEELIPVLIMEMVEGFSIDDTFGHYGYLFCGFSSNELKRLENEFLAFTSKSITVEVLNYEILDLFLEEGVFDLDAWKTIFDKSIDHVQIRYSAMLDKKYTSLTEYISFCQLSLMGIEHFLKQEGVTTEESFLEWIISHNQTYKQQLARASKGYINSIERLKSKLKLRDFSDL